MGNPKVSVILPVYNAGELLKHAVRSILDQSFSDFELLILDDGSSDGCVDNLKSSLRDSRIRYFGHANMGLSATLNRGIEESSGEYICRMDADDVSDDGRLAAQVDFLASHPGVVLVGTQIRRLSGDKLGNPSNFPLQHAQIVAGLRRREHVICHPSTMLLKSAVLEVGGYWDKGVSEDWDLFLKLSKVGYLANLDECLLDYRFHSGGINVDSLSAVRWNMRLAIDNSDRRISNQSERSLAEFRYASSFLTRLSVTTEVCSLRFYRLHLRFSANDQRASSLLSLGLAAIFWPAQAIRRLNPQKSLADAGDSVRSNQSGRL